MLTSATRRFALAIAAALLTAAGCAQGAATVPTGGPTATSGPSLAPTPAPSATTAAVAPSPTTQLFGASRIVTLAELDGSGVSGTATFTDAGDGRTQVAIKVTANYNNDMIAAITPGTCASYTEKVYVHPDDVRNGVSVSIVSVSMAELFGAPYQIHLHTAPEIKQMAACGDLQ
jgi:hypothetical protein